MSARDEDRSACRESDGADELMAFRGKSGISFRSGNERRQRCAGSNGAIYSFRNAPPPPADRGKSPFRSTSRWIVPIPTWKPATKMRPRLDVDVIDDATKKVTKLTQPVLSKAGCRRFSAFRASITSGNFHILLHCQNSEAKHRAFPQLTAIGHVAPVFRTESDEKPSDYLDDEHSGDRAGGALQHVSLLADRDRADGADLAGALGRRSGGRCYRVPGWDGRSSTISNSPMWPFPEVVSTGVDSLSRVLNYCRRCAAGYVQVRRHRGYRAGHEHFRR